MTNFKLYLSQTIPSFPKKALENIVGKEENAGNPHFLLFPQCFLPYQRQKPSFKKHSICRLQMLSFWSKLKICRLVKR